MPKTAPFKGNFRPQEALWSVVEAPYRRRTNEGLGLLPRWGTQRGVTREEVLIGGRHMDAGAAFLGEVGGEKEDMASASVDQTLSIKETTGIFPPTRRMEEELFTEGDPETMRPGYLILFTRTMTISSTERTLPHGARRRRQNAQSRSPSTSLSGTLIARLGLSPASKAGYRAVLKETAKLPPRQRRSNSRHVFISFGFLKSLFRPSAALRSPQECRLNHDIEASAVAKTAKGNNAL